MTRVVIFSYKNTSRSARKLQSALDEQNIDTLYLYPEKEYRPRHSDLIIGWGSGNWPEWKDRALDINCTWLNQSDTISNSVSKDTAFELFNFDLVPIPHITRDSQEARVMLRDGHIVLARTETEGHDGSGLIVMRHPRDFISADLYTQYEEKTDEFRVHVWQGETFWGQIREIITDRSNKYYRERPDMQIRTSSNGWTLFVYNRNMPDECKVVAQAAIKALGLDFGAVDIGWNAQTGRAIVYETNTSPELSNRTCDAYVSKIIEYMEEIN